MPLGRAADRTALTLQPYDLLDFVPRVAEVKRRAQAEGITVMPGNNLGYFGPEEALLRSPKPGGKDHWIGCQAGRFVLGIESSCDEMAAAVVRRGCEIVASVVHGQAEVHRPYGGVVPELASRDHVCAVSSTVEAALERAGLVPEALDAVAVTAGALRSGLGCPGVALFGSGWMRSSEGRRTRRGSSSSAMTEREYSGWVGGLGYRCRRLWSAM